MEDRDGQLGVQQLCAASSLYNLSTDLTYVEIHMHIPFRRICAAIRRVAILSLHVL
jgi:hypothetical protein